MVSGAVIAFGDAFLHLFDARYVSPAIETASILDLDRLIFMRLYSKALDLIMPRWSGKRL